VSETETVVPQRFGPSPPVPQSPEPPRSPQPSVGDPSRAGGDPDATAPQQAPPEQAPPVQGQAGPGRGGQFAQRVDQLEPGAGAFANQLAAGFQTPGVLTALLSGLIGALACFGVGLVLAIAFPDESLIGAIGEDVELWTEAFGQTVSLLLAKVGVDSVGGGLRLMPMLMVLVPVAACAAATFSQAGRTGGLAPRMRLVWGAAVGLPFALLMLIASVSTGDVESSVGGAFLLGLVWGALGGVLGMFLAIRRDAPETLQGLLPAQLGVATRVLAAIGKPLVVLLVSAALIGTAAWWLGSLRDHESARGDRSLAVSLVENTLFAGEHGVNYAALGAGVQFEPAFDVFGFLSPVPLEDESEVDGDFRLFDLGEEMQPYFFVPLLIVLIALPLLLALYAGFAAARVTGSRQPGIAAAWGALVGPVWAIGLALFAALHVDIVGSPSVSSLFGIYLLAGAVVGALGGLLAAQSASGDAGAQPGASNPYA